MQKLLIDSARPIPGLLSFITEWVPDLSPLHRLQPQSIPRFVPPPLRQIYELTGNYPIPSRQQWRRPNWTHGLFGSQDQLLPPDRLRLLGERFAFIHENQGVWSCETLANHEDPPVFADSDPYDHPGMQQVCSALSHFLTTFCLQELAFGSQHLFCVDSPDAKPDDLVTSSLSPLWINGTYAYFDPSHSFFLCEDRLLVMDVHTDLWIAFNSHRHASLLRSGPRIRRVH